MVLNLPRRNITTEFYKVISLCIFIHKQEYWANGANSPEMTLKVR